MQLKYFSLLFSIAGITLLYVLSTLSQPLIIELCELPEYEGKQVITEGTVTEHHTTTYGSQIITIKEDNATIIIFVEGAVELEYGDKIQVTGTVQKYKDDWEIVVNDERFIILLEKWQNISFPLWQLAENPTKYDGLNVNVTGYVDVIYDSYFYLVDETEEHSLIVFCNPSEHNVSYPGQKVNVAAQFTFDEEAFQYKLTLCEEMHHISLCQVD